MRSEKTQFAMSGPDLSLIPGFDVFNEEAIQAYIVGKQNFRNGCRTVACGDVAAVRRLDPGSDSTYSVVVHAEKSSNKNYLVLVKVTHTGDCGVEARCPCDARGHEHHRCKHAAAALLTLLALTRYKNDAKPPRWGHRPNIKRRFTDPNDLATRAAVRYDLDWQGVLRRALADPERHNGASSARAFALRTPFLTPRAGVAAKIVTMDAATAPKARKRRLYCVCNQPYAGEFVIMCCKCKDWFHPACLTTANVQFDVDDDDFECQSCQRGLAPVGKRSAKVAARAAVPAVAALLPPPPPLVAVALPSPVLPVAPRRAQVAGTRRAASDAADIAAADGAKRRKVSAPPVSSKRASVRPVKFR